MKRWIHPLQLMSIFSSGMPSKWPFPPVVGWCRSFHWSWSWTMERLASSLVFCVRHYCRHHRQSDTLCCVRVTLWQGPFSALLTLRVRCDGPRRSSLSLIANKLILWLQTAEFTTPAQLHVSWNFHFTNTFSCFCNNSQWQRCHVSTFFYFLGDISRCPGSFCSLNMTRQDQRGKIGNKDNI